MNRVPWPLFLTVLLVGCPHRIDFGDRGEITDPKELIKAISWAEAQVISVKGEAKIKVESPQNKGVVTLYMAVTHPSLIHLESLNFFGKPQAVLVSDGQTFGLYVADEGKYYRGPASAQNISRFLPVVLAPEELTALMLGRAPRVPSDAPELKVDEQAKAYVLTLKNGAITQTLWVHPKLHRVVKSEIRGVNAYDLAFENLDTVGQVTYPRRVVMTAASASTTLELLYKDVAVNETPDLSMFDQEAPANVPVIEVDEAGKPRQAPAP